MKINFLLKIWQALKNKYFFTSPKPASPAINDNLTIIIRDVGANAVVEVHNHKQ